ncbi:hypothetical protein P692DRAFT_201808090 [Suillus brevipes Sb2]|nr:hypothetical protein P692DRAFT_201808090 [Suillus brevipes Sb2]
MSATSVASHSLLRVRSKVCNLLKWRGHRLEGATGVKLPLDIVEGVGRRLRVHGWVLLRNGVVLVLRPLRYLPGGPPIARVGRWRGVPRRARVVPILGPIVQLPGGPRIINVGRCQRRGVPIRTGVDPIVVRGKMGLVGGVWQRPGRMGLVGGVRQRPGRMGLVGGVRQRPGRIGVAVGVHYPGKMGMVVGV